MLRFLNQPRAPQFYFSLSYTQLPAILLLMMTNCTDEPSLTCSHAESSEGDFSAFSAQNTLQYARTGHGREEVEGKSRGAWCNHLKIVRPDGLAPACSCRSCGTVTQ